MNDSEPTRKQPDDISSEELLPSQILGAYLDRLNSGDVLDFGEISREYPDLAPELIEKLNLLQEISTQSSDESPLLGTLGDYTLRRQIGRGGMGVVYEAWQKSVERPVALKVLPGAVAADDKAFNRFMREARAAGKLHHPNIVGVHSLGQEENTPYYAMEYVEGETLADILKSIRVSAPETKTPFGPKDQVDYFARLARAFADVADGLQHAHSMGVIHRDIKPSNLILDPEDRLRILDFGLAHLEGQESLTGTGDYMGTPLYMSPEQAKHRKVPIDHRTDLYSLGVTMYEMLTGRPPFRGKDHQDTLSHIAEREPTEPRKLNHRVPRALETIVLKCMRKNPDDPYGTAEALGQDLRRFVRGDPIEARAQSRFEKFTTKLWRLRGRVAAIGIIIILVTTAAALGFVLHRQNQERIQNKYTALVEEAVFKRELGRLTRKSLFGDAVALDSFEYLYHLDDFEDVLEEDQIGQSLELLDEAVKLAPAKAAAFYHHAFARLLIGDVEKAREEIDLCLIRDSSFTPAQALKESLDELESDHEITEPGRERVHVWKRAFVARRKGNWVDAAAAYRELIRLESADPERHEGVAIELLLGNGIACLATDEFVGAALHFAIAHDRWPDALEPTLLLGKSLLHMQEKALAERVFNELFLTEAEQQDRAALAIAAVYRALGRHAAGLEWANKIQQVDLRERTQADFLCQMRDFDGALEAGNAAVKYNPSDARNYKHLTWAVMETQMPLNQAEDLCKHAISVTPENSAAHSVLACIHYRRREVARAFELFEEARILDQKNISNLIWYANVCRFQGNLGKGLEIIKQAHRLEPRTLSEKRGVLHILGDMYLLMGEYKKAYTYYRDTARMDPGDPWKRTLVAQTLAKLGRLDEALDMCDEIRNLGENDLYVRSQLGRIYTEIGELDLAIKEYHAALLLKPDDQWAHKFLGMAFLRQGKLEDAAAAFQNAIDPDPLSVWAPYTDLGKVLWDLGRVDEAFEVFADGILSKPQNKPQYRTFMRFHRRQEGHHDFSELWDSFVEQLEVIIDKNRGNPLLLNTLAVGCLHGKTRQDLIRARELISLALEITNRSDSDILETLASIEFLEGKKADAIFTLEEALALPRVDCFIEHQLDRYRKDILPTVVSLSSIDAILAPLEPGDELESKLLDAFSEVDEESPNKQLYLYLEGRIHQRHGRSDDAVESFKALLASNSTSSKIIFRLAESLRSAGDREEAEWLLRDHLRTGIRDTQENRSHWHVWLSLCLVDLDWSAGHVRSIVPSSSGYGKHVGWILDQFAAEKPIRINCGGKEFTDAKGNVWGPDRFSLGGRGGREGKGGREGSRFLIPINETDDAVLYQTVRLFPLGHRAAYVIPLMRGSYSITLHFADGWYTEAGCRRFDVIIENKELKKYDPIASVGFATAETYSYPVNITDGTLDIEFVRGVSNPTISAIEINPLKR